MTTVTMTKAANTEEKYCKRRKQKKEQRMQHALYLMGIALMVLVYTWWSLLSTVPEQSSEGVVSPESLRQRPVGEKEQQPKFRHPRHPRQFEQLQQHQQEKAEQEKLEKEKEKKGGILQGIGNLFKEDKRMQELKAALHDMNRDVIENKNMGIRWVRSELLPPLHVGEQKPLTDIKGVRNRDKKRENWGNALKPKVDNKDFFRVKRANKAPMLWEKEDVPSKTFAGVDFTKHSYEYPKKLMELPATLGDYPPVRPLKDIMQDWPQDDIDGVPSPFKETLIHFDYTNPEDVEAARTFRDAKLPFKFINVPEVVAAGETWTDDYVSDQFDPHRKTPGSYPKAGGTAQESPDNFFAFFSEPVWSVEEMGIPPTRNNDWSFDKWAEHARYADAVGLDPNAPHFYWQAGVPRDERYKPKSEWTFVSHDLPSLSSPTETFFVFEPDSQKGIQCRFGERGVTAATHYDAGRNMIAMVTGAKRYILSPPNQCAGLGLVTTRANSIFRHSLLNFGHLNYMDNEEMPEGERAWLERSRETMALDTVLKAGEVLYIPSFWFHYITSLQKSAQCNVRSGVDPEGDKVFGGKRDVTEGCMPR